MISKDKICCNFSLKNKYHATRYIESFFYLLIVVKSWKNIPYEMQCVIVIDFEKHW